MKIILVNGPPGSGKDEFYTQTKPSLGSVIQAPIIKRKFATPLYTGLQSLFGLDEHLWGDIYNNHKDEPCDRLLGMTPRNAMIWLSEDVMKPRFGKAVFGQSLVNSLTEVDHDKVAYCIVTDSGFIDEAKVVVEAYGKENVILINVSRDGCTFENDSRQHVSIDDIGGERDNAYSIVNDDSLEVYAAKIRKVFQSIKEKK